MVRMAECDNCERVFPVEKLDAYKDFWSRVEIGNEIPAGDCPECGAFCYLKDTIKLSLQVSKQKSGIYVYVNGALRTCRKTKAQAARDVAAAVRGAF